MTADFNDPERLWVTQVETSEVWEVGIGPVYNVVTASNGRDNEVRFPIPLGTVIIPGDEVRVTVTYKDRGKGG